MEDRLKRLRNSMKKTTFSELEFTQQTQQKIREKMNRQSESEECVFLAVMQLLNREKTGFEIAKDLRSRGIQKFEDNEGFLYSLLHQLEQKNFLETRWDESSVKLYQLNSKGRKILQKAEKNFTKEQPFLKELLGM